MVNETDTGLKIWGAFGGLFLLLVGLLWRSLSWESVVMRRIETGEKFQGELKNAVIAMETVCKVCPINEVRACQSVLKQKVATLEANYANIDKDIDEIKQYLKSIDGKMDQWHHGRTQ
jgi:hypothetical protein